MSRLLSRTRVWLLTAVVVHLAISIVHGAAHSNARVPLSPASNLFVLVVILAGPLVGLALSWRSPAIGAWIVASTMAAALVFGVLNHFVFDGPDHVAHVDPQWRTLFAATALLLALTEGLGSGLAITLLRREHQS
jgi:hypothetical protein